MNSMVSRYNKPQPIRCKDNERRISARKLHREVVKALFPALKTTKKTKKKTTKKKDSRSIVSGPIYRTKIVNGLIVHEDDGKCTHNE